jgi:hypothetical protein
MITFKDFKTSEELEQFQKDVKVNVISIETVVKEKWVAEYFNPKFKYTYGYRTFNEVRLFYTLVDKE